MRWRRSAGWVLTWRISWIGRLTLGVNEGSGGNQAAALRLTADPQTGTNNWVFFAVTYDPSLASNQLNYFFGRSDKLAYIDSTYTYLGGYISSANIDWTGPLTVGNLD